MKKQTRILLIAVIALTAMVGILAFLNRGSAEEKKRLQQAGVFKIIRNDKTLCEVSMADLQSIGFSEIKAMMDTSTTDPAEVTFSAVQVKDILANKNVSLDGVKTLEFRAIDGYASAVSLEEAKTEQNVYICTKKNGMALGTKSEGGMGPYLMIIKSSQFSQRWCKFLQEIVLE